MGLGYDVAYTNCDLSPLVLREAGCTGIGYTIATYVHNPSWINEAHALGLKVYAWTVNGLEDINHAFLLGIDCVLTDTPQIVFQ